MKCAVRSGDRLTRGAVEEHLGQQIVEPYAVGRGAVANGIVLALGDDPTVVDGAFDIGRVWRNIGPKPSGYRIGAPSHSRASGANEAFGECICGESDSVKSGAMSPFEAI